MKPTILKAMMEIGGKCTTTELREHMGIVRANNFSANMTELFNFAYLSKGKDPKSRGGNGNIWTVTQKGKKYLLANKAKVKPFSAISNELEVRHSDMLVRKANREKTPQHPQVSKGASRAIDSIAILIEENQNLNGVLLSIRSMIDNVLNDRVEETVVE